MSLLTTPAVIVEKKFTMYPLRDNMFAYVKTRKGEVKIYLKQYIHPSNVKGGSLITQRSISLDLKTFLQLIRLQKHLKEDYHRQMTVLLASPQPAITTTARQEGEEEEEDHRQSGGDETDDLSSTTTTTAGGPKRKRRRCDVTTEPPLQQLRNPDPPMMYYSPSVGDLVTL